MPKRRDGQSIGNWSRDIQIGSGGIQTGSRGPEIQNPDIQGQGYRLAAEIQKAGYQVGQ